MGNTSDRLQHATMLLDLLEKKYPGLIHPWDPKHENDDYSGSDLQSDIALMFDASSHELYLKGGYHD